MALMGALGACDRPIREAAQGEGTRGAAVDEASRSTDPAVAGREGTDADRPARPERWSPSSSVSRAPSASAKRCDDRISEARNSEQRAAVQRDCGADPYKGESFANSPGNELVTLQQLKDWWTEDPVLGLPGDDGSSNAKFIAQSPSGGRSGDPARDPVGAVVVYESPPATVATSTYFQLIAAGSTIVRVMHHARATDVNAPESIGDRPVQVRGRTGFLTRLERGRSANVDWLTIRWLQESARGSYLVYEVGMHPRLPDADAVALTNSLVEL